MYKYNFLYDDWSKPLRFIYKHVHNYEKVNNNDDTMYTGLAIRDLCKSRDNGLLQNFKNSDCRHMIDLMCTY